MVREVLNLNSEVWGIVLVLILDLLAIRAEKRPDLSATLVFRPAWQRSGCFLDYEHEHKHDF